ncbi:MAG: aldo/keto reductase [Bacilli bacterium]|nr:aldo/keto reductase [Bacilli bacterium]
MDGIKLNDGYVIPRLGLGTFRISREDAERSVEYALRNGYDHIDTANVYLNEEAVGRGIKKSERKREEIFITSKIFPSSFKDFPKAVDETLERLQLDYIDLLLLHRPYGNYKKAYQDLVAAQKAGKVRSIGVSNFTMKQLKEIIDLTGVVPVLNQIECNPYNPRIEIQKEMNELGIITESWFPFASGSKKLFDEPVLIDIAKKREKSVPQIILAYLSARDVVAIPGSRSEAHIKSNLESLSIELSPEEVGAISKLRKGDGSKDWLGPIMYRLIKPNFFEKK